MRYSLFAILLSFEIHCCTWKIAVIITYCPDASSVQDYADANDEDDDDANDDDDDGDNDGNDGNDNELDKGIWADEYANVRRGKMGGGKVRRGVGGLRRVPGWLFSSGRQLVAS